MKMQTDLVRYEQLISSGAYFHNKVYDTQLSSNFTVQSGIGSGTNTSTNYWNNLNDTIVTAPFTGTLSMDDVNIGTYVAAGNTPLVTISSADPLYYITI